MIGDLAKRSIIEDGVNRRFNPRIYLSLKGKQPSKAINPIADGSFFYTNGIAFVEHKPTDVGRDRRGAGEYLVTCDILQGGNTIRVKDYTDLKEKTKDNKKFQFFLKHSTLSAKTFKIAYRNTCTKIPFCVKIEEIYDELVKKYGDVDNLLCEPDNGEREMLRRKVRQMVRNDKKKVTGNWL